MFGIVRNLLWYAECAAPAHQQTIPAAKARAHVALCDALIAVERLSHTAERT